MSILTSSPRFAEAPWGSDPDAALYWLARMLEAGEDALYVARRMVRFASEDVGNADPLPCVWPWGPWRPFDF